MRRPRESGFSLVELLLVAILLSIVTILALRAFGPVAGNTRALRAQAAAVGELRCATEMMLADFGGAASVRKASASSFLLKREQAVAEVQGAWSPVDGDLGITYSLDGSDLRRTDAALGTSVLVARSLSRFEIDRAGAVTSILMEADDGQDTPSVTLLWDPSGGGP